MTARSLVLALFLVALLVPVSQAAQPGRTAATTSVYLPSLHSPPPLRVENVSQFLSCDPGRPYKAPCTYWVSGVVRNITTTPLYSVVLRLDLDAEISSLEIPLEPEDVLYTARPVLGALFPDEPVAFSKSYEVGAFAYFTNIAHIVVSPGSWSSAPPDGRSYHQLTVVEWAYADAETLTRGTVRNDTGRRLHQVKVIVTGPGCAWVEADPVNAILDPGATLAFRAANNVWFCIPSRVITQGVAE